jgi:hypothetical protein
MKRLSILALALVSVVACATVREDELACEDAAKHLQSCCPGLDIADIDCSYTPLAGHEGSFPDFSVSESACIRGASCDGLRAAGVCTRAAYLVRATLGNEKAAPFHWPNVDAYNPSQVCP